MIMAGCCCAMGPSVCGLSIVAGWQGFLHPCTMCPFTYAPAQKLRGLVKGKQLQRSRLPPPSRMLVVGLGLQADNEDVPVSELEFVRRHDQGVNLRDPSPEDDGLPSLEEEKRKKAQGKIELQARLLLFLVPIMWGTYAPSMRFIYAQPVAPSPSVLTFTRKVLSVLFVFFLLPLEQSSSDGPSKSEDFDVPQWSLLGGAGMEWAAAAELGLESFLGTAFQTVGLESTTATRASFLLQSITIFVPVLSAAFGAKVSPTMWVAATMALCGVSFLTLSRGEVPVDELFSSLCSSGDLGCSGLPISFGDVAVLGAAGFYALGTVRLGFHASKVNAVQLAGKVIAVTSVFSAFWVLFDLSRAVLDGQELGAGWEGLGSWSVLGAIVFSAIMPGTLAAVAQTTGQKIVPASEAQVYFSLQPLWSAAFASIWLDERLSSSGWIAGMVVLSAGLLASYDTQRTKSDA